MTSPRRIGSNTLNYMIESNVQSSCDAIKANCVDLAGKIIYDDETVFRRLRLEQVDQHFVASCKTSFNAENHSDIALLKHLVQKALKKSPVDLEEEEKYDKVSDPDKEERSGNHGSTEEKKMYAPLVRLFNHISSFSQATPLRTFRPTNCMLKADEPHTFGFPSVSPDFTITTGEDPSNSRKWCDRDSFVEVKPSNLQGPKSNTEDTIPSIVAQSANYARLFMSARPFMLFCVGILIFGTEFCVGIFDRDGITFSPIHDMFGNVEIFIRVVYSISCKLSIYELGFDPTVRVLTDQETMDLTGKKDYPSAVISSVGNDPRQWCTIGPPIWSSLSFLGRGTNVWHVRQYVEDSNKGQQPSLQGKQMVLKTAWRSSARTSESDIYLLIGHPPEGLAKFVCGGDVISAGHPISVNNLRVPSDSGNNINSTTPILHRLILDTIGLPMWEYKSEIHLLKGFRDALKAHKDLCSRGILHRDISAGNVLFTDDEAAPCHGFITDLEFARIEAATLTLPGKNFDSFSIPPQNVYNNQGHVVSKTEPMTRKLTTFETTVPVKRGAGMTGTAQFMAWEILTSTVRHEAKHDVESFIWVLSYCIMRNLCPRSSHRTAPPEVRRQSNAMLLQFSPAFSRTITIDIATERQSRSKALFFPRAPEVKALVEKLMSPTLISLFKNLQVLIHNASHPVNPVELTHDALLTALDNAIASLSHP